MALELPLILGSDPKLASIILQGFLQQNILFDAMSGHLSNSLGISFLEELTNVCSMIGMLVLIFSPSLWKAKYLISWTLLFLVVTLGGSRGFEFAYNFAGLPGSTYVNMPLNSSDTQCTFEEKMNNDFYCNQLGPGTKINNDAVQQATGLAPETMASTATENGVLTGQVGIKVDDNNTASYFSIYGFKPQVFILYLTNRLNFELERALTNLNSRIFKEEQELIKILQQSQLPDPQLKQWVHAFKSLCSDQLNTVEATKNMAFEDVIALGKGPQSVDIAEQLSAKTFNIGNSITYFKEAHDIQKNDFQTIVPLMDINVDANSADLLQNLSKNATKSDKDLLRYYALQTTDSKQPVNDFSAATMDEVIDRYGKVLLQRDMYDIDNSKETAFNLFEDKKSVLKKETPVNILMPELYIPDSERKVAEDSAATSQNIGNKNSYGNQSGIKRITNCGELYYGLLEYEAKSRSLDNKDFSDRIKKTMVTFSCSSSGSQYSTAECTEKEVMALGDALKGAQSIDTIVTQKVADYTAAVKKGCEGNVNVNECQDKIKKMEMLRVKAAVANAIIENNNVIKKENEQYSAVTSGATGTAYTIGKAWTELWTGPLSGLKSIGLGFKAGAYSAILPVIKNILVAFILVLTPIFFLIGLLVPAWSLGVITTSLITLLFLQMTDVTMTIIDAVLHSVEKVVSASASQNLGISKGKDYNAFIEVIWGMAYVSSFAITAFLLFAVGNTKAIVSKMAGLDTTVASTANEIASKGWDITKAGASIAAGAATGGTMGGALGAKTAGMIAQGKVLKDSLMDSGLSDTLKGIGGTTAGNYAGLIKSKELQMAKTAGTDDSNLSYISEGQAKSRATFLKEKKAAEADHWAIEYDSTKTKSEDRGKKAVRDLQNNESDIHRVRVASYASTNTALDLFRMTDDSNFDSYEISNGPGKAKTKVMGTAEQLRRFGFDNTLDAMRKPDMTKSELEHATSEAGRVANAIIYSIGHIKGDAKRDYENKRLNFNSSYDQLRSDISKRLEIKGGDHVDDDTIKKALTNMGITENNGNFFINDKIVERDPRGNDSSNNSSTIAQNTQSLPGRGNGKKNTRDS